MLGRRMVELEQLRHDLLRHLDGEGIAVAQRRLQCGNDARGCAGHGDELKRAARGGDRLRVGILPHRARQVVTELVAPQLQRGVVVARHAQRAAGAAARHLHRHFRRCRWLVARPKRDG
jgi:hypothetical protein